MLIDKAKIIANFCLTEIKPNDGYVAIQMNARDVLEMAETLIRVDEVLKEMEAAEKDREGSYFTAEIFDNIRKALDSNQ